MRIFFLLFVLFCAGPVVAQTVETGQVVSSDSPKEDPEIKDLQWNRYVKDNYVVLSIDDSQGRWLIKNLHQISNWCTSRWGLSDASLSKECRIFCVPNNNLLKKLFNLDESKAEIRKEADGSTKINVIWVSLESLSKESISPYLTHIVLPESKVTPYWFLRGAEIINSSLASIKNRLEEKDVPDSFSFEKLFSLTNEGYLGLSQVDKKSFDHKCLILCLMLRKELGQLKLLSFLDAIHDGSSNLEDCLRKVYGYKDLADFESKYKMYYNDLLKDLDQVPESYFLVKGIN
jgi:hypothetical protein